MTKSIQQRAELHTVSGEISTYITLASVLMVL